MSQGRSRPWSAGVRVLVLIGLAVTAVGAVWWYHAAQSSRLSIRNVVLISIDTCRADRLSSYGFKRTTTPNIDAVADRGIRFANVVSPVPLTLPAHSTMLTGTSPISHGVHDNIGFRLGPSSTTLAEILQNKGYATGAVVSTLVLQSQFGLDQGFTFYHDRFRHEPGATQVPRERSAIASTKIALDWLGQHRDDPFFLFLHFYDPHDDYSPPAPFDTDFADDLYAGEIAYADHCVGIVLNRLKTLGLLDSTLIVVTSDHGEMLEEHGELKHDYFIYQSAIRVPLIFKIPGHDEKKTVHELVGLVDLMPTILSLLNIDPPPVLHGTDLTPSLWGNPLPADRAYYCESQTPTKYGANPLLGIVTDRWKFIDTKVPELYDLAADPGETTNLAQTNGSVAAQMQARLKRMLSGQRGDTKDSRITISGQTKQQLASIGYVGVGVKTSLEIDKDLDDPKDLLGFHQLVHKTESLILGKSYDEAHDLCMKIIKQRKSFLPVYYQLADIAVARRQYGQAVRHVQHVIDLQPGEEIAYRELAEIYRLQGAHGKEVEQLEKAIQFNPRSLLLLTKLGMAHYQDGDYERAIVRYREALVIKKDLPGLLVNLAHALYASGQSGQAIKTYRDAVQINPGDAEVRYALGVALKENGRPIAALREFEAAARLAPRWHEPRNAVAWVLATSPRAEVRNSKAALVLAEQTAELTQHKDASVLDTLAAAHAAAAQFEQAIEIAQKAITLAVESKSDELATQIEARLQLYKAAKPYVEP